MNPIEKPIQIEQLIHAPIHKVWEALTTLKQMKQWYFPMIKSFNPVIGFKTEFTVEIEDRVFIHQWEVTEVVSQQKIAYQWTFGGYTGKGISAFELIEVGKQTLVKLTFTVLKSFPQNIPEFKRESGEKGWKYLIKESLKAYLE